MRHIFLILVLCLTGCSHGLAFVHSLTLVGRNGTRGSGTATMGVGTGTVEVAIAGETYRGQWTAVSAGANSVGTVLAQSDQGGRLRCEFTYGGWTDAGFGTCRDAAGLDYDMQIR